MAGLKSFLQGVAPILGVSAAALYERQRALVNIGVLETTTGRGPGSGVPFTADNFAAILISLLAAESLSKVDECVADLCRAIPLNDHWVNDDGPNFRSDVGRLLSGKMPIWVSDHIFSSDSDSFNEIRVTRPWRGQLVNSAGEVLDYFPNALDPERAARATRVIDERMFSRSISVTAAIEREMLAKLITFTSGALSQIEEDES